MDLDALLGHYLGTADTDVAGPVMADAATLADATDRIAIDFAVERDPGRRFALWALMAVMGGAPSPETAFKAAADRQAAHDFARLLQRGEAADDTGG